MTHAQWMFEYYSLVNMEQERFKDAHMLLRKTLVSVLGLDMLRPVDDKGIPKNHEDMTPEEREAFLPLVTWCARPDMLKPVIDQHELATANVSTNADAEYEALCAKIDENVDDLEPLLGIDPNAPVVKTVNPVIAIQLKQLLSVDATGKV
jgi:hypothetical protein